MVTLPFRIESPLATAIVVGLVASMFGLLWWSYEKNVLLSRDILLGYFRRRLSSLPPAKSETAAKLFLSSMTVLLSIVSIFGFSVAFGIIQNGEKSKARFATESQALQQYMDGSAGEIDVKELIRQNKLKQNPR